MRLCRIIAEGELVTNACRQLGVTRTSVYDWLDEDLELADIYARARELQAHAFAEQVIEISDNLDFATVERISAVIDALAGAIGDSDRRLIIEAMIREKVQRDKIRVDSRKWFASKIAAKLYGDRPDVERPTWPTAIFLPEPGLVEGREALTMKRLAAFAGTESVVGEELPGYEYVDVEETPRDITAADPDVVGPPPEPIARAPEQEILAKRRKRKRS